MGSMVDRWNAAYFDNRLSPEAVAALDGLTDARADAQALADRVFRLMRLARFDPTDLTSLTAWVIGSGVPRAVPSAWEGAVLPITMTGRHQKLDDYIARNPWHRPMDEPVLVDLGCGFPPFTAVDSAAKLTGWRIIGVDPSFSRYLVYDDRGDYACFDDENHLRYYHIRAIDPDPAWREHTSTACCITCCHYWWATTPAPWVRWSTAGRAWCATHYVATSAAIWS